MKGRHQQGSFTVLLEKTQPTIQRLESLGRILHSCTQDTPSLTPVLLYMEKRMPLVDEKYTANTSITEESSRSEQFVCRVARSGIILKFKVNKFGTFPSESTIPLQQARSSNKEINSVQNVIPLLEQAQITNMESSGQVTIVENAESTCQNRENNRAMMMGNNSNVTVLDNSAIRLNEAGSSKNAKMDNMENLISGKRSPENNELRATKNGSDSGRDDVHTCSECGKSFDKINSLYGHMGTHRREEYKGMRMMPQQPITVEAPHTTGVSVPKSNKKNKSKMSPILVASMANLEMSMAPICHPKQGTATIDISTSVTSSDAHSSGETDQMLEVAMILTTLVERIREETVKVPTSSSGKVYVCTTCNKTFSSYHALGGHRSFHNKPKNRMLQDGVGSSSGSSKECTWKYVCVKCNRKFATGQSFGGHKRKHYFEELKMMSPADGNVKPPVPQHHETIPSSEPAVLPTDGNMHLPVRATCH